MSGRPTMLSPRGDAPGGGAFPRVCLLESGASFLYAETTPADTLAALRAIDEVMSLEATATIRAPSAWRGT